jgi:putative flippase GtrA
MEARGLLSPARQREALLILRFGLAGLLNTGFGYMCFAILILIGAGPTMALVLATAAGVAFNFQTSRRLVFGTPGNVLRFGAVYAGVFALNWLALNGLIRLGAQPLVGQALLILPVAALSFLVQRILVFRLVSDHG